MIGHWFKAVWRALIGNPLFSLITIASLSVGCCGALLAGATIKQHLSFDRWLPDAERVLLVRPHFAMPNKADSPASNLWFWAMKGEIEKVHGAVDVTRVGIDRLTLPSEPGAMGEQVRGLRIEPNFFDFFRLTFIEGDAKNPRGIVLSESLARKLYGAPPWVGKSFRTGAGGNNTINMSTTVSGVIRDMPATAHLRADVFNYHIAEVVSRNAANWHGDWVGGLYVRLAPDVNVAAFQSTVRTVLEKGAQKAYPEGTLENNDGVPAGARMTFSSLRLPDIHLAGVEKSGLNSTGELTMLLTLGGAALALLLVSGFNFITLSLARSLKRRREVAMRKVLGAGGDAIMWHYLAESLLLTVISLGIGFALADLLHPWFARAVGQPDALVNLYDPVFLAAAIASGVVLALVVGAYPSLYLARVRPHAGLEQGDVSGSGPVARLVSGGLLGLQIASATILLALALTMAAQSSYVAARPLGYEASNTLSIAIACPPPPPPPPAPGEVERPSMVSLLPASACDIPFLETVRRTPGVVQASRAGTDDLYADRIGGAFVTRPGQSARLGDVQRVAVETDFLQMMNATLLAGRIFDGSSAFDRQLLSQRIGFDTAQADTIPVIVTRAFLPLIDATSPQEAIAQRFAMPGYAKGVRAFEIVGVVEDWHRRTLRYAVDPIVFTPGGWSMQIIAKVEPGAGLAVRAALQGGPPRPPRPGGPPFVRTILTLDDSFSASLTEDRRLMAAVGGFAAFAMAVGGLGVFALTAFEIRRRVREIGIRKALGATPAAVAGMVIGRSLISAAIASVLSWPIAWWLSTSWLNGFVYRTDLGLAVLPVATLAVLAFVMLAVSINALRAARTRPSLALRAAT